MNTEEIQTKIKELQEEYKILNEGIDINFTIKAVEHVNIYYGIGEWEDEDEDEDPTQLQEEMPFEINVQLDDEEYNVQYEEQVKNHRKEFQARIDNFEDRCKELAKELEKDLAIFLREDIIVD
jgi:hypothetical protein